MCYEQRNLSIWGDESQAKGLTNSRMDPLCTSLLLTGDMGEGDWVSSEGVWAGCVKYMLSVSHGRKTSKLI